MLYVVVLCSKGMICLRDLASILLVHKYSTCFSLCDGHFRDFRARFQLVPAGSRTTIRAIWSRGSSDLCKFGTLIINKPYHPLIEMWRFEVWTSSKLENQSMLEMLNERCVPSSGRLGPGVPHEYQHWQHYIAGLHHWFVWCMFKMSFGPYKARRITRDYTLPFKDRKCM